MEKVHTPPCREQRHMRMCAVRLTDGFRADLKANHFCYMIWMSINMPYYCWALLGLKNQDFLFMRKVHWPANPQLIFFSFYDLFTSFSATRSAPWTDFETMTLINMWGEAKMQQELRGTYKNSRIFSLISKKLSSHGYSRTPEQCQTRLKRLKTNFRQCYQNKYVSLQLS